jgi:hypothetical protein
MHMQLGLWQRDRVDRRTLQPARAPHGPAIRTPLGIDTGSLCEQATEEPVVATWQDRSVSSCETGACRWIALDGAVNARVVIPSVLIRSDNLQSLTARDVRVLVEDQDVEVVVDLRTDIEVRLEGPGPLLNEPRVRIEHHSLYPESGGNTDLDAEPARPWGSHHEDESPGEPLVVRAYMSYLRRRPDSIVASIRAIARAGGAVLVHCAAGKDRTGVVVALALDAAGAEREAIVSDYLATGERIEAIMARLLGSPTYRAELEGHDPQRHAPLPGTIERVLDLVDARYGGARAWLSSHGLGEPDLRRLTRRLTPIGSSTCG